MSSELREAGVTIRKGTKLGSGGFGVVYRATEISTGREVALKQSRVSLRVKRSLLRHEAAVLQLLSGHRAIPEVYAYGRVEHFELLSMQLLGQSLGDTVEKNGPFSMREVLQIADQMLSALGCMHSHGLVHRDIKPDNILLQHAGSPNICLVDFGLTYWPPELLSEVQTFATPSDVTTGVFGTLAYASLNAHNTQKLSYRDDLESLAYSLVWFLRGSLPWSYYTRHGNRLGRLRQVHEQKQRYSGPRLANGLPREFGAILDYARSLSVGAAPDYAEWQKKFKQIPEPFPDISVELGKEQDETRKYFKPLDDYSGLYLCLLTAAPSHPPPVEVGQIVLTQLLASVTGEGYSIRAGHQRSYVPDPCFDLPEWLAPRRPSVVTQIRWDERVATWSFTAVAIARQRDDFEDVSTAIVPILGAGSTSSDRPQAISAEPDWPLGNSYCHAFRRPMKFHCLPTQERVPSIWTIVSSDRSTLAKALTPGHHPDPFATHDELESPDQDVRHDARMREGNVKLYAWIFPLSHHEILDDSIPWYSSRAWFDECVKASRYNDLGNGRWWTNAPFPSSPQSSEGEISDSYTGSDFEEWECQQERDESITLGNGLKRDGEALGDTLEGLREIVLEE
ncbi:hypothetical protein FS749_009712 [Ceratobasidium sp. UAMH 11750]|nr:hypothetical protein FS749_009712 [Ceratobasidium sp. UAMH 11750]